MAGSVSGDTPLPLFLKYKLQPAKAARLRQLVLALDAPVQFRLGTGPSAPLNDVSPRGHLQNEAGGTGGGLLNRFAPKGVGIVPSVLRHAYHARIGENWARKMCMPFGAGKVCYVRPRGGGW